VSGSSKLGHWLGAKVRGVRVTPISIKISAIFVVFLLLSNFVTNYINLTLNRTELIRLTTDVLVRDMKDLYQFTTTQAKLYQQLQTDLDVYTQQIGDYAKLQFKGNKSLALGFSEDGKILFQAGPGGNAASFDDPTALSYLKASLASGLNDGSVEFTWNGERYFGIYRFNESWNVVMVRAEEWNEFYEPTVRTFTYISIIIVVLTIVSVVIGILLIRYILRFVGRITESIMAMQESQSMDPIDMIGATNDEVAYLGIAINSLSSTIQNLLNIFKKFVARDIAQKAYVEREIRLEGAKRELAIMFSDIKSFTHMTETLGTDIIKLLNMHYSRAIEQIHLANGDIGSIIGDAVLAIFGVIPTPSSNKSIQAVRAGFKVLDEAENLRNRMEERRSELLRERGYLTPAEMQIYEAVCLEVGVGIDGGEVFYGNIGSNERMVNTVIGDNVNSSSRLEGLTRVYRVPMIVSDYIRAEVTKGCRDYYFLELDQVQVKGKSIGKRVFYPIASSIMNDERYEECERYQTALQAYYAGDWDTARQLFRQVKLAPARIFEERIKDRNPPENWSGIWTMAEK